MNNNILELNKEEVSEFIFELCQGAQVNKDDTKLQENLTGFISWIEDTLYNATLLSVIYKGFVDVQYNSEDGFYYNLNEEFREKHLDVFPRDDNPIWSEISSILEDRSFG